MNDTRLHVQEFDLKDRLSLHDSLRETLAPRRTGAQSLALLGVILIVVWFVLDLLGHLQALSALPQ